MKKESICIAIDFDGTCVTHAFPEIGKDIGAGPILRALVNKGHKLILNTMRSNNGDLPLFTTTGEIVNTSGNFLDDAIEWFALNHIELYAVQENPDQKRWTTSPKCYAQLYIDDAALGCPLTYPASGERPYVDWVEVVGLLEKQGIL